MKAVLLLAALAACGGYECVQPTTYSVDEYDSEAPYHGFEMECPCRTVRLNVLPACEDAQRICAEVCR